MSKTEIVKNTTGYAPAYIGINKGDDIPLTLESGNEIPENSLLKIYDDTDTSNKVVDSIWNWHDGAWYKLS